MDTGRYINTSLLYHHISLTFKFEHIQTLIYYIICSVAELSTGRLFVINADSSKLNTQQVQVYNPLDGTYLFGFGGASCGDEGDKFLCQPFNGLTFIPR